jgi:hypothetical protein
MAPARTNTVRFTDLTINAFAGEVARVGEALAQAEAEVKSLQADVASMESAQDYAFRPPPRAWIVDRVRNLNQLLAKRTEASALALRTLTGPRHAHAGEPSYVI